MGKGFDLQAPGPEFNPQDPHEKQGMVVHAWDSVPRGGNKRVPGAYWSVYTSHQDPGASNSMCQRKNKHTEHQSER